MGLIGTYVRSELNVVAQDYTLLREMNTVTAQRYADMNATAKSLVDYMDVLHEKQVQMKPMLDQIDAIDQSISVLEHTVELLDAYTKRLEISFRKLDNANNGNGNQGNSPVTVQSIIK